MTAKTKETPNKIENIKEQLNQMSLQERAELAQRMGLGEQDFPQA